ncbi:ferredoxin [Actinomadura chokoriensis]|uniref:Ferredoxin n=1 Tax=Actinomadura chokoriensis TaxID=454156 RepID=A0ABV4QUK4_9ACTN
MRASVDPERCAGHGVCVVTCPSVFALTGDGYSEVTVEEIPEDVAGLVERAARQCPERAITLGTLETGGAR